MRCLTLLVLLALPTALSAQTPQADTLAAEAKALFNKGRFAESDSLYRQALKIKAEHAQENSVGYTDLLCGYVDLCIEYDKLEGLDEKLAQILAVRKKNFGEQSLAYAEGLNHLGRYLTVRADYDRALEALTEAAHLRRELAAGDYDPYINTLISLGTLNYYKQDFDETERYYSLAAETARQTNDEQNIGAAAMCLATLYCYVGQFDKSHEQFAVALPLVEKHIGQEHPNYITALSNFASLCIMEGDYYRAEAPMTTALALAEKVLGEEHSQYFTSLSMLAYLYNEQGKYEQAEKMHLRSVELRKRLYGPTNPVVATALNHLSIIYLSLANYKKAEQASLEALNVVDKNPEALKSLRAVVLNTLGLAYVEQKHYDKGLNTLRTAFAEQQANNLTDDTFSLIIVNNICATLFEDKSRDISTVEQDLNHILSCYKELYHENSRTYLITQTNLASLYASREQYAQAFALFERIIEGYRNGIGQNSWQYGSVVWLYASALDRAGRAEESLSWHRQALECIRKLAWQDFLFLSEQERELYWQARSKRVKSFQEYAVKKPASDYAAFCYDSELFTKSLLLSSAVAKQNAIYQSDDRELISLWRQMKSKRNTPQSEESHALERELLGRLKEAGAGNEFAADWRSIREKLSPGEAAIELINVPIEQTDGTIATHYYALVLCDDSEAPELVSLCSEKQLRNLLGKANNPSDELRRFVWDPLEPALKSIHTIYLSPSGALNAVAFAALPYRKGYLTDRYTIHNLLSTRDIATCKSTGGSFEQRNLALFGGADFGLPAERLGHNPAPVSTSASAPASPLVRGTVDHLHKERGQGFDYLPGSLSEVQAISKIVSEAQWKVALHTDQQATEEQLKAYSGHSPKVLHISTHGFYFPPLQESEQPNPLAPPKSGFKQTTEPMMRSGLLFSGANNIWNNPSPANADNDGVLTAYEIANLDLTNTELVVLSACDTGLGDIDYSEGIYGLQRAFRLAGVRAMIVSLWRVPDKETTLLMTEFYRQLTSGRSVVEAFSLAQFALRERYPTEPEKWGAFVLVE